MHTEYNFYCDESLHLPNDGSNIMVLGGIWCPKKRITAINKEIASIKSRHSIKYEMKWVKISQAVYDAYYDLVKFFFGCDDLHFRALVVDNKEQLRHDIYKQTHDEWYYKMYFYMLNAVLDPMDIYNIYLDIKDTKSKTKIKKLREVLSNSNYDFSGSMIKHMQVIRSEEVEVMQIVDILIGAMAYVSRDLNQVRAKVQLINYIKEKSGYTLKKNTLYRESKFNIFHFQLSEGGI